MPAQTPSNKGTSPSKLIQRGIDQSWGKQTGTTSPQDALANKFNKNTVDPGAGKKGS